MVNISSAKIGKPSRIVSFTFIQSVNHSMPFISIITKNRHDTNPTLLGQSRSSGWVSQYQGPVSPSTKMSMKYSVNSWSTLALSRSFQWYCYIAAEADANDAVLLIKMLQIYIMSMMQKAILADYKDGQWR